MSPAEIVEATALVAAKFGEDIAHEVCCIYLQQPPVLDRPDDGGNPMVMRWWLKTARFCRAERWRQDYSRDRSPDRPRRLAERYWAEVKWALGGKRSTPEQWAACWELVERVPKDVVRQLVELEGAGQRHDHGGVRQRALRRFAMQCAQIALSPRP